MGRVKVIHKTTGTVMWVTENSLNDVLAVGHKLAASNCKPETEPKVEEPKEEKPKKKRK